MRCSELLDISKIKRGCYRACCWARAWTFLCDNHAFTRIPERLPGRGAKASVEILESVPVLTLKSFLGRCEQWQRHHFLLCAGHDQAIFAPEDSESEPGIDYAAQGHSHRVEDHFAVFTGTGARIRRLQNSTADAHQPSDFHDVLVARLQRFFGRGNDRGRDILAPHLTLRPPFAPFRLSRNPLPSSLDAWTIGERLCNRDGPIHIAQ